MKIYDFMFSYFGGLVFKFFYLAVKRDENNQIKDQKMILKSHLNKIQTTQFWSDFKFG